MLKVLQVKNSRMCRRINGRQSDPLVSPSFADDIMILIVDDIKILVVLCFVDDILTLKSYYVL